ncbi:hypothetical protein H0H92_011515 [Tricholoma furcatifolium]|nr:hypothetical protein H0H92_011515 [Tricholoma furcatifolium]
MVHLILSSTKGNQGLRYFPYVGYLGLTPVKVEGVVRTKSDPDAKQLLAKSLTISVRCYESRLGRVSVLHSNVLVDYTQVLWSKPDGEEYAPIDELEFPFRIIVPARVGGFSTSTFVDYRCMWRVEAVLNHVPITAIGSRQVKHFELPLVRYDVPPYEPSPPSPARPLLLHQTTKPKAPRIRYTIDAPTYPIGPLDIVSIPVHLLPMDDTVTIRSATVMIERRIQLNETVSSSSSLHDAPSSPIPIPSPSNSSPASPASSASSKASTPSSSYHEPAPPSFTGIESISSDLSSDPTITPHSMYPSTSSFASDRPLLGHTNSSAPLTPSSSFLPSKLIVTPIIGAESSGQFARSEKGVWTKTVTLQWPAAKSHSRWAVGETIQSELVSISVSSQNGTESIELSEKELLFVSTNEAERKLALSKYSELLGAQVERTGRSKSKSPRRGRREMDSDLPPPPAPFKASSKQTNSTGNVTGSGNGASGSSSGRPRRPHTSAGPRDNKAFDFSTAQARMDYRAGGSKDDDIFRRREEEGLKAPSRPESSQGVPSKRSSGMGKFFSSAPKMSTGPSGSSNSASASGSTSGSVSRSASSSVSSPEPDAGPADRMREWEEELAKIEMLSRQSSNLLGFGRKRSTGATKVRGEMAPDLRRKVDAARNSRLARETEMKKQVDAQLAHDARPEDAKPIWADSK